MEKINPLYYKDKEFANEVHFMFFKGKEGYMPKYASWTLNEFSNSAASYIARGIFEFFSWVTSIDY